MAEFSSDEITSKNVTKNTTLAGNITVGEILVLKAFPRSKCFPENEVTFVCAFQLFALTRVTHT